MIPIHVAVIPKKELIPICSEVLSLLCSMLFMSLVMAKRMFCIENFIYLFFQKYFCMVRPLVPSEEIEVFVY